MPQNKMQTPEERKELMRKIKDEVVALKESPLYEFRIESKNLPVIGEGSHFAKIMFIGEAPGRNEAKTGRPFWEQLAKFWTNFWNQLVLSEAKYILQI